MNVCPLKIDRLLKKKFFISQSSSIYGGVSGLYDYGPYGTLLKSNIINKWRRFFIEEEDMYEIDSCILTPYNVLKASGHVDKFVDLLVYDKNNDECYRADHFLERELGKLQKKNNEDKNPKDKNEKANNLENIKENNNDFKNNDTKTCVDKNNVKRNIDFDDIDSILNNLENLVESDIDFICKKYNLRSEHGNEVGNCTQFNLIFKTFIGPKSNNVSFLRPETAQSQFINFKKLYELNNEKLPFASASIGKVFRNEISPRSGLVRVREFEQAEIEYYVHPENKEMKKLFELPEITVNFLYNSKSDIQELRKMKLVDAVKEKIIDNETLGYFIGRTYMFLIEIGIKDEYLRFRQHKNNEMAHYACDCWDAEIFTSYGWIECVGIADRGVYDLTMHQKASGTSLSAQRKLKEPKIVEKFVLSYDKKIIAQKFKKKTGDFIDHVAKISQEEILQGLSDKNMVEIEFDGEQILLNADKILVKHYVEDFVPGVIEPSFGIGRILYALIEHNFYTRPEDENRNVLRFTPEMAPIKCVIGSIINGGEYDIIKIKIQRDLKLLNCNARICYRNVSPGKRYASYDEIGVPFFITVDPETLDDGQATVRERDSMEQIRISVDSIAKFVIGRILKNSYLLK